MIAHWLAGIIRLLRCFWVNERALTSLLSRPCSSEAISSFLSAPRAAAKPLGVICSLSTRRPASTHACTRLCLISQADLRKWVRIISFGKASREPLGRIIQRNSFVPWGFESAFKLLSNEASLPPHIPSSALWNDGWMFFFFSLSVSQHPYEQDHWEQGSPLGNHGCFSRQYACAASPGHWDPWWVSWPSQRCPSCSNPPSPWHPLQQRKAWAVPRLPCRTHPLISEQFWVENSISASSDLSTRLYAKGWKKNLLLASYQHTW